MLSNISLQVVAFGLQLTHALHQTAPVAVDGNEMNMEIVESEAVTDLCNDLPEYL